MEIKKFTPLIPFFLFILFLFFLAINSVNAVELSFSDFGISNQQISIYYNNGSYITTIYSNETINLNETYNYMILFHPTKTNILENPYIFKDWFIDYLPVILSSILLLLFAYLMVGVFKRKW